MAAQAAAPQPPAFRLPDDVRPVRYDLELTLRPDADRFSGVTGIDVVLDAPRATIWLQAEDLDVSAASVTVDGATVDARPVKAGRSWLGLDLSRPIGPGRAHLTVRYTGKIRDGVSLGLFRSRIDKDAYLFTQFEEIDARKAFPCFDEPRWKTPFRVTLRVPAGMAAVANAPVEATDPPGGGMEVTRFRETAPLPTYLVAFAVGPFDVVDGGRAGARATPLRYFVPRGRAADAAWLAEVTRRSLVWLEGYFGVPYPYDKLDTVVTTSATHAMENAGLILTGSYLVLPSGTRVTDELRARSADLMLHEMGHHWFGDLVTPAWWDEIWLNESFATWIAAKGARALQAGWHTAADEVSATKWAMTADSSPTARRIRQPVVTEYDIGDAFDSITYAKGGAVLTMIERTMGPEVFRRGLKAYFEAHAHGVATTRDFLASMSGAAGKDMAPLFESFVDQPGVPVVSGAVSCAGGRPRLAIAQERLRPIGQPVSTQTWRIPLCVRHGRAGEAPATECFSVDTARAELPLAGGCPDWIVLNAGHDGYYLAAYDRRQLSALAAAGGDLAEAEVLGTLADLHVRAAAGLVPLDEALEQAGKLAEGRGEDAETALTALYFLGARHVADDELAAYRGAVQQRFGARARELGLVHRDGDTAARRALRSTLAWLVGYFAEDEQLGGQAVALTRDWLADRDAIEVSLRTAVLGSAVRAGGGPIFDALRRASPSASRLEQYEMLAALTSTRDPALLQQAFALPEKEPVLLGSMNAIFAAPRGPGRQALLRYLDGNLARLWKRLPRDLEIRPLYFGYTVCTSAERAGFLELFGPRARVVRDGVRALDEAVAYADQCIAVRSVQEPAVSRFLRGAAVKAVN